MAAPNITEMTGAPGEPDVRQLRSALKQAGAVLIRPTSWDLLGFEAFTRRLCDRFHYSGARGSLREAGDGFTTSTFEYNFTLLGHTEGTFRPAIDASHRQQPIAARPADVGFLFCEIPPSVPGGDTVLVDGVRMLQGLEPSLRARFERDGLGYHMTWDRERWQNEFAAASREELVPLLQRAPGTTFDFVEDMLHLFFRTPAITLASSGERVFAPAALAHLPAVPAAVDPERRIYCKSTNRVCFGDGEELPGDVVQQLIELHDALTHAHRWQRGDLLVLDNTRFMHGRTRTTTDCERKLKSRFGWFKA